MAVAPARAQDAQPSLRSPVTDETFYFVMADRFENGSNANDRGSLDGDYLTHGSAPERRGFYHGGDLKGLLSRIDYIRGLGTDSIWLTPSFKNKAGSRRTRAPAESVKSDETVGFGFGERPPRWWAC